MSDSLPLLMITAADLRRMVDERNDAAARLAAIEERLRAIATLVPEAEAMISGKEEENEPLRRGGRRGTQPGTLREHVLQAVKEAPEGLSLAQIRDVTIVHPIHGEAALRNPNNVYSAVSALQARGEVVKRGSRVYLPERLQALIAEHGEEWEGFEEDDVPAAHSIIMQAMAAHPAGLTAGGLRALVLENPEVAARDSRNKQYVYSVLARLVRRGKLRKSGEVYMPAELTLGEMIHDDPPK